MVTAQDSDFGTDVSTEWSKTYHKRLRMQLETDVRTRDHVSAIDRLSAGLTVSYKLTSWVKASAGYSFLCDHTKRISLYEEGDRDVRKGLVDIGDKKNERVFWQQRHRLHASLTFRHEAGRLKLTLRERWQYTYRPEKVVAGRYNHLYKKSDNAEHLYHGKGKNVLRSRLAIDYDIRHCKVTPMVSIESFNAWQVEKMRYTMGATWEIDHHNSITFFYRYQHLYEYDDTETDRHIAGLKYHFRF